MCTVLLSCRLRAQDPVVPAGERPPPDCGRLPACDHILHKAPSPRMEYGMHIACTRLCNYKLLGGAVL